MTSEIQQIVSAFNRGIKARKAYSIKGGQAVRLRKGDWAYWDYGSYSGLVLEHEIGKTLFFGKIQSLSDVKFVDDILPTIDDSLVEKFRTAAREGRGYKPARHPQYKFSYISSKLEENIYRSSGGYICYSDKYGNTIEIVWAHESSDVIFEKN